MCFIDAQLMKIVFRVTELSFLIVKDREVGMVRRILFILVTLLFFTLSGYGEVTTFFSNNLITFTGAPHVEMGSHINRTGYNLGFSYTQPLFKWGFLDLGSLQFKSKVNATINAASLGIPGASVTSEISFFGLYGFGPESLFPDTSFLPKATRLINAGMYVTFYFSSDGTSQYTINWLGEINLSNHRFRFRYENDDWNGFKNTDEFRTAAAEVELLFTAGEDVWGGAFGFKLWTGTLDGLPRAYGGESYDMSGQFGGNYSSGILYVSIIRNEWKLSLGWDSENIRDLLQNKAHEYWWDCGTIPLVDRPDRFYIQFSYMDNTSLY